MTCKLIPMPLKKRVNPPKPGLMGNTHGRLSNGLVFGVQYTGKAIFPFWLDLYGKLGGKDHLWVVPAYPDCDESRGLFLFAELH